MTAPLLMAGRGASFFLMIWLSGYSAGQMPNIEPWNSLAAPIELVAISTNPDRCGTFAKFCLIEDVSVGDARVDEEFRFASHYSGHICASNASYTGQKCCSWTNYSAGLSRRRNWKIHSVSSWLSNSEIYVRSYPLCWRSSEVLPLNFYDKHLGMVLTIQVDVSGNLVDRLINDHPSPLSANSCVSCCRCSSRGIGSSSCEVDGYKQTGCIDGCEPVLKFIQTEEFFRSLRHSHLSVQVCLFVLIGIVGWGCIFGGLGGLLERRRCGWYLLLGLGVSVLCLGYWSAWRFSKTLVRHEAQESYDTHHTDSIIVCRGHAVPIPIFVVD
jgi:hypothetical protein